MSSDLYQTCASTHDSSADLDGLLKCITNGNESSKVDLASGLDTFYLLFAGALVFFMQAGFAMLLAGSIRSKSVKNVLLWNLLDSSGGGLAFWLTGYAFAYGGDGVSSGTTFIGNANFLLMGHEDIRLENWFFQFAFACAVSSIVAGTIAERTKMTAYLCYSIFLVGFAYPVVAHAFWSSNGMLSNTLARSDALLGCGAVDFAGSGPVHMMGGVTALVAAVIIGPRIGRFTDGDGNILETPQDIPAHSVSLQMLGTFALWFGWYGFNPGSTFAISTGILGDVASLVAVNTTLAACSGAIGAMVLSTLIDYQADGLLTYDVGYTMNGALTGLVGITAGGATLDPWAAVVTGFVAGFVYIGASKLLVKLRIDDAVDAVPVHMFGGAWGLIATGLFSTPFHMERVYGQNDHVGWFYEWGRGSGNFTLLGIQLLAILLIMVWTVIVMGAFFHLLKVFGLLRITPEEEEAGMDISRHKGSAYNINDPDDIVIEDLSRSRSGRFKTKEEECALPVPEQDTA